ncbi:sigma-70 family RNA polymerase sigma factor [Streptomyces sp. NPDC093085]|uniref:RNA polymerase sigma factor n=1 Tax=Streptomyces sp. NPDC093085 TaxID=3155068 RepID=UPI00341A0F6C
MTELPSPDDRDDRGEYLADIRSTMPPALEAFHDLYVKSYLNYAYMMLGDKRAAEDIVRGCIAHLALNWLRVTRTPSPEAYAWALLKGRVETRLNLTGRDPQMVETAAFQRAAREVLASTRCRFEVMETALGLYTAIAALPERQYDVIVLLYVLGYPSCRVADIMGIERDTVRSHRRLAKRRIAQRLGLPQSPATDQEKE